MGVGVKRQYRLWAAIDFVECTEVNMDQHDEASLKKLYQA